ncbi:Transducin beta-like protein 3 [Smittium culicis]|uniref:Transducin beta-like protein 3 n=1 Tax=Smittium culicis TaxID=133412 RepID=A0A1R1YTP8_9FUNG|nr:Transducin beta-like protein 3 [Smittium culicis]
MESNKNEIQIKNSFQKVKEIDSVYTNGKVAVSKDGEYIYTTCSEDVYVLKYGTAIKVAEIKGDDDLVTSFSVSDNSKYLVMASRSLQIKIVDLDTKSTLKTFKGHSAPIISMDFDESSTLLATGASDSSIKVWDVERGYCTHNLKGHSGVITGLKFKTINKIVYLATASENGNIRIYNLNKNKCETVFNSHVSVVKEMQFSADGSIFVSAGRDSIINVWSFKTKKLVKTIPVYEAIETVGIVELPESEGSKKIKRTIYIGGEKGQMRTFDLETGSEHPILINKINADQIITQIIYSSQNSELITVSSDQNLEAFTIGPDFQLKKSWQVVGHNDEIIDMGYVGTDQSFLAVATNSEQLRIYDVETLQCKLIDGHSDILLSLDVHSNGVYFATGSKDKTAKIWEFSQAASSNDEMKSGEYNVKLVGNAVGHTGSVGAVKLSVGEDLDFMVSGGQDRTIKLWDLSSLNYSGNSSSSNSVTSLKTKFTVKAHDKDINAIAVSPNSKLIASASQDRTIKLWSSQDGTLQRTFSGHKRGVWAVDFSSVDMVLASSSADTTIKIWSLSDGTCLKTLEGHTGSPLFVKFISSGMQLLSSGSDGLIKLWSLKTSECDLTLDSHEDKVWTLAIKKDEQRFASGASDSKIVVWEDTTQLELEKMHKKEADNLLMNQALNNYLMSKDYVNSISLALALDKPHTLMNLFIDSIKASKGQTVQDMADGASDGKEVVYLGNIGIDKVIGDLETEQLGKLLVYTREWNTNARLSYVAHAVLGCIFKYHGHEKLVKINRVREIVSSLIPYSERHLNRLDRMLTDTYILDYALHSLESYLVPDPS